MPAYEVDYISTVADHQPVVAHLCLIMNTGQLHVIVLLQEKKEQEEREREARIAAAEKESKTGVRHIEQQLINNKLTSRNLKLHDVSSFCRHRPAN